MKQSNKLPNQELLKECFEYFDGMLFWKVRPLNHFPNAHRMNRTNSEFAGTRAGGFHHTGYEYVKVCGQSIATHRIVWSMFNGAIPERHEIDHIDGTRSNNRIENLRLCVYSGNASNQTMRKDNSTGYRGVCYEPSSGKFMANIQSNKKQKKIGRYKTAIEAALAYDAYARKLHGEFASLNFPKDNERKC